MTEDFKHQASPVSRYIITIFDRNSAVNLAKVTSFIVVNRIAGRACNRRLCFSKLGLGGGCNVILSSHNIQLK